MRQLLLAYGRRLLVLLGVSLAAIGIVLAVEGCASLFGAVILGCFVGAAAFGTSFWRIWRSADLDVSRAKRQMAAGAVIRLVLVSAVLAAAAKIGEAVFFAVAGGFGLFYVLFMAHLVFFARRINDH